MVKHSLQVTTTELAIQDVPGIVLIHAAADWIRETETHATSQRGLTVTKWQLSL